MTEPLLSSKHAGVNRYRSLEPKERKGVMRRQYPGRGGDRPPHGRPPPSTQNPGVRWGWGVGAHLPTHPPPPHYSFHGG